MTRAQLKAPEGLASIKPDPIDLEQLKKAKQDAVRSRNTNNVARMISHIHRCMLNDRAKYGGLDPTTRDGYQWPEIFVVLEADFGFNTDLAGRRLSQGTQPAFCMMNTKEIAQHLETLILQNKGIVSLCAQAKRKLKWLAWELGERDECPIDDLALLSAFNQSLGIPDKITEEAILLLQGGDPEPHA
ncbi:MAG: hypothetical protein L6Q57_06795 [Alphaproteobacteria bacterium]|nr:hypothetical protein [Alphaproteobacteria bacterium]